MSVAFRGFVAALALATAAVAQAGEDVMNGAEAMNTAMGARQTGMGGAGIGETGVSGAWVNPALLVGIESRVQASVTGGPLFMNVDSLDSGQFQGGVAWKPGARYAVGVSGFYAGSTVQKIGGDGSDNGEAHQSVISFGATGAYSMDWLRFGVTVKILGENFAGYDDNSEVVQNRISSDLGLAFVSGGFLLGASIRNLGPDIRQWTSYDGMDLYEKQPTEVRAGLSYFFRPSSLKVAVEAAGEPGASASPCVGGGLEWWASPVFALRGGVQYAGGAPAITTGLSAVLRQFDLDFGLRMAGLDGLTMRVGMAYNYGRAATERGAEREPEPEREPVREEKPVETARPAGSRLNFAIADLTAQGVSASDAAVMADILRGELVKTGAFTIIEKQNMDKVLAEQGFQQTGCTSEECAVKIGKLLNVQRMAVGSFGKLMDSYIMSIRVVNVETGAIGFAESVEGEKVSDLRKGVKDLALRMAKQIK